MDRTAIDKAIQRIVLDRIADYRFFCHRHQPMAECDKNLRTALVVFVDDYTFPCGESPTGLCGGTRSGDHIVTRLYEMKRGEVPPDAEVSHLRTREQMWILSGGNPYWLGQPKWFWGQVPRGASALLHELCHYFGDDLGHVSGREECEPLTGSGKGRK